MKKNEYNIQQVEYYYNGDVEKFDAFLNAIIREYVNEDKIAPDTDEEEEEEEKDEKDENNNVNSLDFYALL